MKSFYFIFGFVVLILSTSSIAELQNGNFETGSYANWTSMSGTAFQDPANQTVSTLISWEDNYYVSGSLL